MPYTEAVGDVVRALSYVETGSGQAQEWGMHYACAVSGGGDTRLAIAGAWDTAFTTHLLPLLAPDATYFGSKVTIVKATTIWGPAVTVVNTLGTDTNHTLPTQVRPLISLKTAMQGRHFRGRMYIPTPSNSGLSVSGHPSATYLTALAAYSNGIVLNIVSGGTTWIPCIYHRTPTGPISHTFTPITLSLVSNLFATQRRSGDYGRLNTPTPW